MISQEKRAALAALDQIRWWVLNGDNSPADAQELIQILQIIIKALNDHSTDSN